MKDEFKKQSLGLEYKDKRYTDEDYEPDPAMEKFVEPIPPAYSKPDLD
jgi:hypothetical protein